MAGFEMQKRGGHNVIYLSRGTQAIRVPTGTTACEVARALAKLPPASHDRRKRAISKLNEEGITAS